MPNPEDFRFHTPGPKSPPVEVGERLERRLTPDAELRLRVQCIERVLLNMPIAGWAYGGELKSVGLKKLDMQETAFHLVGQ